MTTIEGNPELPWSGLPRRISALSAARQTPLPSPSPSITQAAPSFFHRSEPRISSTHKSRQAQSTATPKSNQQIHSPRLSVSYQKSPTFFKQRLEAQPSPRLSPTPPSTFPTQSSIPPPISSSSHLASPSKPLSSTHASKSPLLSRSHVKSTSPFLPSFSNLLVRKKPELKIQSSHKSARLPNANSSSSLSPPSNAALSNSIHTFNKHHHIQHSAPNTPDQHQYYFDSSDDAKTNNLPINLELRSVNINHSNTQSHPNPDLHFLDQSGGVITEAGDSPYERDLYHTGLDTQGRHPLSLLPDNWSSTFDLDSTHSLHRQSSLSCWTVASSCSHIEDLASTNLASINLPSLPENSQRPQADTPLISSFPLPPLRHSFITSPTSPYFDIIESARLSPSIQTPPSLPPQIPLPPLPCSQDSDTCVLESGSLSFRACSPVDLREESMIFSQSSSHSHQGLSNKSDSIHLTSVPDALDNHSNILDMHMDRNMSLQSLSSSTSTKLVGSDHTNNARTFNSKLPVKRRPARAGSCDSTSHDLERAEEFGEITSDPQIEFYRHELSGHDSDAESGSSEIDLNEPLESMAVRLGYQLEIDEAPDSDDESDIPRAEELEDDTDLLQNFRFNQRPVVSRQAMSSRSSFRSIIPQPLKRVNRLMIAEASSSDEEEFDLKLDHRDSAQCTTASMPEWCDRRCSSGSTISFSTTPSSSHQTNLSTPNSTQALKLEPFLVGQAARGTIGLGFEMEVLQGPGVPSKIPPHFDHREPFMPGKQGSVERQEWLHRAFSRGELTYALPGDNSPRRSTSLNVQQESTGLEASCYTERYAQKYGSLDHSQLGDDTTKDLQDTLAECGSGERRMSMRNSVRNSLKLKPLMLVSRKSRGISYPSTPLISRDDNPRSSLISRSLYRNTMSHTNDGHFSPRVARTPGFGDRINPRPSLVNLRYRSSISSLVPRSPDLN